jgi:ABC-type transporter Mla maintaining outer membrane lipid asymmetry ATPase subunit MlaF
MSKILSLNNICFDDVFNDVSISLKEGEVYCVIGYTGVGKTLLMKIAGGLIPPTEGEVVFRDKPMYESLRSSRLKLMERIGFLFQTAALISNMNVYDNVALVLRYHTRLKENEIKEKVDYYLDKFHLLHKENDPPSRLSMGERKLAAFARAMVNDPEILILDEPTVLIDKKTRRVISDLIEEYREKGKTIFMTSNDTELIFNLSDTVGVLMDSTLKIEGDPFEIKYSDRKEVKELLSAIKVIREDQIESEILKLLK